MRLRMQNRESCRKEERFMISPPTYRGKLLPTLVTFLVLPVSQAFGASRQFVRSPGAQFRPQYVEYGTASWYGSEVQGRLMASGERFDERALTAAHRTLPLGTTVLVTNLSNGRSVTVCIKDRGPAIGARLIDLSRAAAAILGFVDRGLARVRVQVLSLPPVAPQYELRPQIATVVGLHR
jgi:rare lipoprotein A